MKAIVKVIAFMLFFTMSISNSFAQDIHFSQYFNTPLLINPAQTGDFAGQGRFSVNYRDQWSSITANPYKTVAFSSDGVFMKNKLALGLLFLSDKAGDANLSTTQIIASIATRIRLNKQNYLRFGMEGTWSQNALDLSNLTWNSQFDGTIINPQLPSGEVLSRKYSYADLSTGMHWKHIFSDKTEWNFGLSAFHITQPHYNFLTTQENLKVRWCTTADLAIPLGRNTSFSLHPSLLVMKQGSLSETDLGLYVKQRLGLNSHYTGFYKNSFFSAGGYYRLNDAVITYIRFDYNKRYAIGGSYDFNVSHLYAVSRAKGGMELSLIYYLLPSGFKRTAK